VTLYELATGHLPIESHDPDELKRLRWEMAPADPSVYGVELPAELTAILMRCLKKESGERYASAEALRADLEAFLHHQKKNVTAITSAWRQRIMLFLLLLLVLVLCNMLFYYFSRLGSQKEVVLPDIPQHPADLLKNVPAPGNRP